MSASLRAALTFIAVLAPLGPAAAQSPAPDEILAGMRAAYAQLETYHDTGSILIEEKSIGAPLTSERHTFTTRFAAPKRFYFDYRKDPTFTDERYVIWCAADTFSTWWSATQTVERFAQGDGQNAFAIAEYPTSGAALLVPPLLFQSADLHGPLADFDAPVSAGTETISERTHYVLSADLRVNHWSDATRTTTIWIDAETYLVRRIVQDTPSGMSRDVIQRMTVTLEPATDLSYGEEAFSFSPP